jgi:simple sugar transport system ATP-binding protein
MNDDLLVLEKITKKFGGIVALKDISLRVARGEIIGLVGDNGAGKSTLAKIIVGYYKPDSGKIFFEGREVRFSSPQEARRAGIEIVYQDMALVDYMSIYRNIFLGREIGRGFGPIKLLDKKSMRRAALNLIREIGISDKNPDTPVSKLSGGERQAIAIARAVYFGAKLVIFDEPTSALSVRETQNVLRLIRNLKERGIASIVISHNIHQVYSISDRIVVLEKGNKILDMPRESTTPEEIEKVIAYGRVI